MPLQAALQLRRLSEWADTSRLPAQENPNARPMQTQTQERLESRLATPLGRLHLQNLQGASSMNARGPLLNAQRKSSRLPALLYGYSSEEAPRLDFIEKGPETCESRSGLLVSTCGRREGPDIL